MRTCRHCHEPKDESEFWRANKTCLSCRAVRQAMQRMEAGKGTTLSSRCTVLPGYQWCPKCKSHLPVKDFYSSQRVGVACKKCLKTREAKRVRIPKPFIEPPEMIVCGSCGQDLPKRCFPSDLYRATRLSATCISCRRIVGSRYARRKASTIQGRLEMRVFSIVRQSVRYRIGKPDVPTNWELVFGYTFHDLKVHLETLFTGDMTWEKVLSGAIEIDHVIPRAAFVYETVEDDDFKKCWTLSNLQPLWKADNRIKRDQMPDGSDGRSIGAEKRRLLDEELSVASWEQSKSTGEEIFG